MNPAEGLFVDLKRWIMEWAQDWLPPEYSPLFRAFLSCMAILMFAPVTMMFLTWLERKVVARIQDRIGPNRVGPMGLLQPVADGIKMILKEDIVPTGADRIVHHLVPILTVAPVLMLFLVIPFGKDMVAADLDVGLLFFLGMSAIQTPLVIAAGWGARSKYSVLGSMRAAAQILSYEIPQVMVLVAVVMIAGSMKMSVIVESQVREGALGWLTGWYGLTPWGAVAMVIFMLAATAEANRTPFDMAEAESELGGGFHTEYSGFKFALFQMAEFLSAFAAGALAVALFLGGGAGPEFLPSWAWFMIKTYGMFLVLIWFRGTLPRFRIDQLLTLAWKFLFPMSLLVILAAACWHYLNLLMGWFPAVMVNLALLGSGYVLFSSVLYREFVRLNRPRVMADGG